MSQPIPAQAAMRILGLTSLSTFWRVIYQHKVEHIRYSTHVIRFEEDVIKRLKADLTVSDMASIKALSKRRRA